MLIPTMMMFGAAIVWFLPFCFPPSLLFWESPRWSEAAVEIHDFPFKPSARGCSCLLSKVGLIANLCGACSP